MTNQKTDKIYFPNLDGLRFLAFASVFLTHSCLIFKYPFTHPDFSFLELFVLSGDLGVKFFFTLSGFLITFLLLSENYSTGKINLKYFYMRRILRIWPVYFTVVALAIILSLLPFEYYSIADTNFYLVFSFLINFQVAASGISSSPLIILWSVAVEEQFYLLLPLLLILFTGRIRIRIFILILVISILFRHRYVDFAHFLNYHTLSVCSDLVIGCIAAYFSFHYNNFKTFFQDFKKRTIIVVYLVGFSILILRNIIFPTHWLIAFRDPVIAVFFAFVILEQNYSEQSFYKTGRSRIITRLGKYSYGLYAYHVICITLINIFFVNYSGLQMNVMSYFLLYIAAFAFSVLLAWISYRFMESKFLSYKKNFEPVK